jgi:1-acyl-sn-glycerol-3-phosphate acyltransferase
MKDAPKDEGGRMKDEGPEASVGADSGNPRSKVATAIDRQPPAFYAWQFRLAKFIAWLLMAVLGWFSVRGKRNIPKQGGLLILSNHRSDCDPVAVQVACPRYIRFMAKSELWDMKGVRSVLIWLKCFPVKRGEPDRAAIKYAVALLQAGEAVCVFPEGQLSDDGQLQDLKPGIALIVRMANVPVICVGLRNTERIVPYRSLIPRPAFRRVRAVWGQPRTFEHKADTEEILGWVGSELKKLTSTTRNSELGTRNPDQA